MVKINGPWKLRSNFPLRKIAFKLGSDSYQQTFNFKDKDNFGNNKDKQKDSDKDNLEVIPMKGDQTAECMVVDFGYQ